MKTNSQRSPKRTGAEVEDWGTVEKRIAWLLDKRFAGNRSAMAKALGFTHMVVSRVVAGKRRPGSRLLRAMIEKLAVDAQWLLHGRGEPFPGAAGAGGGKRTPVFDQLLTGPLMGRADQQANRFIDVPGLLSPTQYWFYLAGGKQQPAAREQGFVAGDLLMFETDPTRFPPEEELFNQLCVVRIPQGPDTVVKLGAVSFWEGSDEEGVPRLEVDTFDSGGKKWQTVEDFVFRRYQTGEVKTFHRQRHLDPKGHPIDMASVSQKATEEHPINYGDIAAVWTGILLRSGYARFH